MFDPSDPSSRPRAFISYSTQDKVWAAKVKSALANLGIDAFLAHDDLDISDDWAARILEELSDADIFVPLLSTALRTSDWAPQEIGYAIACGRDLLIIPLSLDGTNPFGFIGYLQGKRVSDSSNLESLLLPFLLRRAPDYVMATLIERVAEAQNFRAGEATVAPLVASFRTMTPTQAQAFAKAAISNRQVWSAAQCRDEFLPQFLDAKGDDLQPEQKTALTYQIANNKEYRPPAA